MNYTIENEYFTAVLSTNGAELQSLKRKSDGKEFIWCGDPEIWKNHAPILFPFIGRPVASYFTIENQKCEYTKNHGFVRGSETKVILQEPNKIIFELTQSENTLYRFPYHFSLQSEYELKDNSLLWKLTVKNTDSRAFKFAIGTHTAFACPRKDDSTATEISDYVIEFDGHEKLTGVKCTPEGYVAADDKGQVPLTFEYGEKDSGFVPLADKGFGNGHLFTGFKSKWVGLRNKKDNSLIKISTDGFPYCMLWQNTSGKPSFVCIEPWMGLPENDKSDHIWDHLPEMNLLQPGQIFTSIQNISVE